MITNKNYKYIISHDILVIIINMVFLVLFILINNKIMVNCMSEETSLVEYK
jgi:hypothetical protein